MPLKQTNLLARRFAYITPGTGSRLSTRLFAGARGVKKPKTTKKDKFCACDDPIFVAQVLIDEVLQKPPMPPTPTRATRGMSVKDRTSPR